MLALQTYNEVKSQIQDNAKRFTVRLREEIDKETQLQRAILKGRKVIKNYSMMNVVTQVAGLRSIAESTIDRLYPNIDKTERNALIEEAMDYLQHTPYYNLTLPQRLKQSELVLSYNFTKSAAVGIKLETKKENMIRVFTEKYPFGAQVNWDERLFLSEAVRLEHHLSKRIAEKKGFKYLKWTLSSTHSHIDMCDQLANAVDPSIEDLGVDPKGVYRIHETPSIPHPNCQCMLLPLKERTWKEKKVPLLVNRIIRRIFG